MPPISKRSVGTPFFISFLGLTDIELQVYKLLPKSECRFYLGGMTLKRKGAHGLEILRDFTQAIKTVVVAIILYCILLNIVNKWKSVS